MDEEEKRITHEHNLDKEEYAAEVVPTRFYMGERPIHQATEDRTEAGTIMGYVALFVALFSIAFYPVVFGIVSVVLGLLAVSYGAKTLGFTAIGFGGFSLLFTILYPLMLGLFY
ncbi:permease [Bacillus sp. 165]|uniref:permease n=1 Tax=Bacillus sp. 165 TaxID=1529117 RepID=UPI001ADC3CFF|nr:permease [Bacillus sp. 165]MBO9129546.1 permease [Bacillus sp. 165]